MIKLAFKNNTQFLVWILVTAGKHMHTILLKLVSDKAFLIIN